MIAPRVIPSSIEPGNDVPIPAAPGFSEVGPISRTGFSSEDRTGDGFGPGVYVVTPPPAPPPAHPIRISRIMEGNLIRRVQPDYPNLARLTRVQGPVVLHAVISRTGTIANLQAISGHPLLVQAALDAVRQWRYRPYLLNGEPVEVDTEITVNFVLARE
jgi:protein TonB